MKVDVLFFATLRDLAGKKRHQLVLTGEQSTLQAVRAQLMQEFPEMQRNLASALGAINEEFAQAEDTVRDGDEVAFFPPVSGGSGEWPEIYRLPTEPIDHDELIESITSPETGAVTLFSGFVRGETKREGYLPQTLYLEYEAYESMALAKMRQVAQEIRERWPLVQGIAIVQRLGKLEVGQNTVLIACAAAHRDDGCFEASRYGIDRLKEIVPVWKKEIGSESDQWIEGKYIPNDGDRADS